VVERASEAVDDGVGEVVRVTLPVVAGERRSRFHGEPTVLFIFSNPTVHDAEQLVKLLKSGLLVLSRCRTGRGRELVRCITHRTKVMLDRGNYAEAEKRHRPSPVGWPVMRRPGVPEVSQRRHSALVSKSHAKFEDSRRWYRDRKDAYQKVVRGSWQMEHAVFGYFEADEPLPTGLDDISAELEAAGHEIHLIGSEDVWQVVERLLLETSKAHAHAKRGESGPALNACDNIRHTLYFLTDLMRAELTGDRESLRRWERRG
jgi:hypothetical protein